MNIPLLISGIIGVSIIFGIAAWLGPKIIRAFYPEEQHERMIKLHRRMVVIAIVVAVIGFFSGAMPFLMQQGG